MPRPPARSVLRRLLARGAALLLLLGVAGCIVNVRKVRVEPQGAPFAPAQLTTPVKAHLLDGSTIVYPRGVTVSATALEGEGERFDLQLRSAGPVQRVDLDSVAAFESFRTGTNAAASVAASLLGTALGTAAAGLLAIAIFGSCPTIYVDSAGTDVLQGEAFSYSIAPLFEMRDVDRIRARPDGDGRLWIEVRNEALETHYLNFMELLEVAYAPGQRLLPDEKGRPVVTGALVAAHAARDAADRDVTGMLAAADASWFASAPELSARPADYDYQDRLELSFTLPAARDSVGLVLRLRNSLLNTVLFYDVMLGAAGARSLDWLGGTLEDIGHASDLGRWYSARSGVRVLVERGGRFEAVARIPDAGPIADKELALVLPTDGTRELRVRLEFLADSWRIDQVGLSPDVSRPAERVIPVATITALSGASDTAAVSRVREPDERYLLTYPGTALRVGFDVGARAPDSTYGYLLAAQGYYTEWVRTDWVRTPTTEAAFVPGDAALAATYERWREVRPDFERRFRETRIPVRRP